MSKEESLEKLASEYIAQGHLESLDTIANELYGCTYRSLSVWGQERIANMIGVKTTTKEENNLVQKLAAEQQRTGELENQLQEAWDQIEHLEIENFDQEMEIVKLRNRRK